jgi:hypothetical protein
MTTRELPILFSGPMVQAILNDQKTQTRRVVNPQPMQEPVSRLWSFSSRRHDRANYTQDQMANFLPTAFESLFGKPGDELWVREEHYRFGHWEPVPGVRTKSGRHQKWQFVGDSDEVLFECPFELSRSMNAPFQSRPGWYKRLARFMPRRASRLSLTVTAVRAEQLHDISNADAVAEGCLVYYSPAYVSGGEIVGPDGVEPFEEFRDLWQSIYGEEDWGANPWVLVREFKRKAVGE